MIWRPSPECYIGFCSMTTNNDTLYRSDSTLTSDNVTELDLVIELGSILTEFEWFP